MDDVQEQSILQLKLGDIIQLFSSSNKLLNEELFIISYIDNEKIIINHPEKTDPVVLLINDNGEFINVSIEQIALLNRSDKDGYLRQNNLNVSDLLELLFVEENGSIDKVYGQITAIEEDMMTMKMYPSNEDIYIDFGYKGIPLELNLRSINVIETFPDDIIDIQSKATQIDLTPSLPTQEDEQDEQDDKDEQDEQDDEQDDDQDNEQTIRDTPEEPIKRLFIDADQLFLGDDLGEIEQEVELGEKERRYGLDAQLNDLLEELLSIVPNEDRNTRLLGNINNMLQKFKQLRKMYSEFDDFNNANKKPKDLLINTPLVKSMTNFNTNLKWLIPVIKARKQLNNLDIEEEFVKMIETNNDASLLTTLDTFINDYYKGESSSSQNKYEQYLRFMNDYFKSYSNIDATSETKIVDEKVLGDLNSNINVIIDNLDDLYSEVAKGVTKDEVELTKSRFNSVSLGGNLDRKQLVKSKMGETSIETISISKGDTLQLSSFLVLPQKLISQNSVHINSQIIDKTKTSSDSDYYTFLRKATSVVNHYVDIDSNETTNIKKTLAKHITGKIKNNNNILQLEPSPKLINDLYELTENDRKVFYLDFLTQFLPSNKEIISELYNSSSDYLKTITSMHDFVKEMSYFMMTKEHFTHDDSQEAQRIINKNISTIKQRIIKRNDSLISIVQNEVSKTGNVNKDTVLNSIKLLLNNLPIVDGNIDGDDNSKNLVIINIIRGSLENYYNVHDNDSSSEAMKKIYEYDNGQFLNLCLSYLSLNLHSKIDLNSELNAIDGLIQSEIEQEKVSNDCREVNLSKKYTTLEELNIDNNEFVYYDPQYDETRYDILDIYKEQQTTMPPPQFKEFLKNKLVDNIGMSDDKAMKEADSMINGKRLVEEGDVAILEIMGDKPRYYTRENNEWKRNTAIKYDVQTGSLLCETKKECYSINNTCADEKLAQQLIKASNIQSMVNIFDIKQEKTKEQLQRRLSMAIQTLYSNKSNLDAFINLQQKEPGLKKKQLANETLVSQREDNVNNVKSPYSRLFQAIMGQEDFVQKQANIVKFVNQFTYDVNDNYWFLCIKTSKKLVPKFIFKLAKAFVSGDDYFMVREQICSIQGVLSDDGDKWVDKHSGYVIKMVDSTGEEGYDGHGYKLHVREVLENNMETIIQERQEQINTTLAGEKNDNVLKFKDSDFTAPYSDVVIKIVNAIGRSIGLDLNQHKPLIVSNVLRLNSDNFTSKEAYDKKAAFVKKQKNITLPSFEIALNLNLLLLSLCFIIIAIQLSKPTMTTKKSVPGCFKYFKGFPYEANGDNDAVVYIACVVGKIKNTKSLPWNSLGKTKTPGLVKKLMSKFEKQILKDKQILDMIDDKRQWASMNPMDEEDDAKDLDKNATLENWNTFKPSLDVNYNVSAVSPLAEEFKREMLNDLKKGSRQHHEKANVLIGKIIEQSTFYKNKINEIVNDSSVMLKNVYQEPYMQNCFGNTPLVDKDITAYLNSKNELLNIIVSNLSVNEKILEDLRRILKMPTMNPHFNTRKTIQNSMGDFTEETIYKYFIKECKFGDDSSIDPILMRLCGNKPIGFEQTIPLSEQIGFLKSNGHQYSNESLIELLKVVGRRNVIEKDAIIELYTRDYFIFREFIDNFSSINDKTPLSNYLFDKEVNSSFERLFTLSTPPNGYIEQPTFSNLNKDKGALRELKNNLSYAIDNNRQYIVEFLQSQTSTSRKQRKQLEDFTMMFDNVEILQPLYFESTKQLLYLMCIVFPNMVINNADFSNITVPKHWGLSDLHKKDVITFLMNFYKRFRQFYSEPSEDGEEGMDGIDESANAIHMFKRVMMLCKRPMKNIYKLFNSLPFTTQQNKNGNVFLFDVRFYTLFVKYIFIKAINIYIKCTSLVNDKTILLQKYEHSKLGVTNSGNIDITRKHEAITESEIDEFMNQQLGDEDVVYNDDMSLLEIMNNYLIELSPLLTSYFNTSNINYDDIYKKVLVSRENEKNTITRTLKDMSDEEREVQNLFKGHKLESWGKGLTKGLTRYVKENYDEEREAMEKRLNHERNMGKIDAATKMNMDIFMEQAEYDEMINQEIENEEYSLDRLGDDDDFGQLDGDEFY